MNITWTRNEIAPAINYEQASMNIIVDTERLILKYGDFETPCSIGRGGTCLEADKKEGDGCTPLGIYPLRAVLFNLLRSNVPDNIELPWRWTHDHDGWSDGIGDTVYNRPVRLPHEYSAEILRRDDPLYDIIVVLGHNDSPPVSGMGSAIFFHLWHHEKPKNERTTEGCVAISRDAMMALLPQLSCNDQMEIIAFNS